MKIVSPCLQYLCYSWLIKMRFDDNNNNNNDNIRGGRGAPGEYLAMWRILECHIFFLLVEKRENIITSITSYHTIRSCLSRMRLYQVNLANGKA